VKSRLELRVADLGQQHLKNISEPVHAYLLRQGAPGVVKSQRSAERRRQPIFAAGVMLAVLFAAGGYAWYAGFAPRLLGLLVVEDRLRTAPHLSIVVLPLGVLG
jgi:hypothetical protein